MTITFESDKDIIVYTLEKIISFARDNQHIFLAQSIWWISSIIGLQQELVTYIDNLKVRIDIGKLAISVKHSVHQPSSDLQETISPEVAELYCNIHPSRIAQVKTLDGSYIESDSVSTSTTETDIHNEVINNCEAFLAQSQKERKAVGRYTRQTSRIIKKKADRKAKRKDKIPVKTFGTQTEGIDGSELRRRKAAGVCQRCAWPQERKGSHKTIDCFRWKRLDKGTAPFPRNTKYNKD
jgi:hypothetical protein